MQLAVSGGQPLFTLELLMFALSLVYFLSLLWRPSTNIEIFSCDQAALWMVQSVRLSVCLSVCPSVCHNFLAATKQLYEWYFLSVCPSVRLSVCPSVCPSVRPSVRLSVTPFWLCSHHRIIMKFSGVITLDQGKVHAKGQGQRSKVKVTEVTTQLFVSGL